MTASSASPPAPVMPQRYDELCVELGALFADEPGLIANLANAAAAIAAAVPSASWVGFYRVLHGELVLGPFQGKIACVRIAIGQGVCGKAAQDGQTLLVPDVSLFPGHIACDAASRSEVVVPIFRPRTETSREVVAVLDLDSHQLAAFDQRDARGLEAVATILGALAW